MNGVSGTNGVLGNAGVLGRISRDSLILPRRGPRKHVYSREKEGILHGEMEGVGRNSDDFLIIRGQGAEKVAYHEMRGVARESEGFSLIRGWGQQKHAYSPAGRSCASGNVVDVGKCFRFQITRDQGRRKDVYSQPERE